MDVLRRFYNSPLWGIPRKLGIDDRIADVYWSAKVATTPERTVTVADTDAIIRVHNKPECQRAVTLNREGPFIKAIFEELEAEDVFVDVGANIGLISTLAAHHCSEVIAFEPAPGNVQRFKTNMQLSGVGDKYTIEQAALGAISGTTRLRLHGPEAGGGQHELHEQGDIAVRVRRGDDYFDTPPEVLKIDVEGNEIAVLRGCDGIIDGIRAIFCEIHPGDGETIPWLERCGFDIQTIQKRGGETHIKALRQ